MCPQCPPIWAYCLVRVPAQLRPDIAVSARSPLCAPRRSVILGSAVLSTMEALVGRQGRHYRSGHGSLQHQRPPIRPTRAAHPVRDAVFATSWLLFEFPTAVLLAVFVGTGWL